MTQGGVPLTGIRSVGGVAGGGSQRGHSTCCLLGMRGRVAWGLTQGSLGLGGVMGSCEASVCC